MHDPVLLVHGGAWAIPDSDAPAHEAGVRTALQTGFEVLSRGGSAVDAVQAAVVVLEDDPTFDAGRGSFLTSDGRVQLDALLMDGGRMKAGGVACVERIRNPIQAARLVLEQSPHVYFVGPGAESFSQFLDRAREAIRRLIARNPGGCVVLFTHGFFMQAFRLVLLFPDASDRLLMQNFLRFHLVNLIQNIDSLEFVIRDSKIDPVEQPALGDFTLQGESSHA